LPITFVPRHGCCMIGGLFSIARNPTSSTSQGPMHSISNHPFQFRRARILFAALMLLLPAAVASANTYYVSTTGSDGNPGSQVSPWATLAKANGVVVAGDVVNIAPGTYADGIWPKANGTLNARITYLGNLANPGLVTVKQVFIERNYITVKGIKSAADFTLYYTNETTKPVADSIAYSIASSGCGFAGAKDCMVAHNTINGTISFLMNLWYTGPPGTIDCERDTLRGNIINVGSVTQGTKGFSVRGFTQHCVADSNRYSQYFLTANGGDLAGRYIYNSYFNTFRDNSWHFEGDANQASPYVAFALRDSSHDNLFERDSMLCGVQSGVDIGGRLVNAGNAAWTGLCTNNHWKGCYFLTSSYVFNQDNLTSALIENCVFASMHSYGLYILGPITNTIIRNCTIASWAGAAMKLEGDPRAGGNQFYSNVFYADSVAHCLTGRPVLFHGYTAGFTQDHNLFFARKAESGVTPATESVYWSSSNCSAPGAGTSWANATGNDVASKFGDPRFVNASFLNFDPHIQAGSSALGLGAGGVDAGAYPFTATGPDVTPPATINNLATTMTSDQTVVLTWTAPGDDGTLGVASAYDLRYSTSAITDAASFSAATPVAIQPVPAGPGTLQSYVLMGLTPGTKYYFAIKARDEVNNWSALGTVLTVNMQATDQVAPKAINDLH
jgi:Protein of unknown function (DUF1565)